MSRIFLDANVWMYAAGTESPHREVCARLLVRVGSGELDSFTDSEVLQEFLYRYWRLSKPEIGIGLVGDAWVTLGPSRIASVTGETMRSAARLLERHRHLSPRDLIHVAAMQEAGVTRICSYDRGFDAVPGIQRVEPAAILGAGS